MLRLNFSLCTLTGLLVFSGVLSGAPYTITSVADELGVTVNPVGITNSGQVTGFYYAHPSDQYPLGFTELGGTFMTLPNGIIPLAISSNGIYSTGLYRVPANTVYLQSPSGIINTGLFETVDTPYGVNDNGVIVGGQSPSLSTNGHYIPGEGFVYANGLLTTALYPGSSETFFKGINDNGLIVGQAYVGGTYVNFTYQNGIFTELPSIPAVNPQLGFFIADGVNNNGVIGGIYTDFTNAPSIETVVTLDNGQYSFINSTAAPNPYSFGGINDEGVIAFNDFSIDGFFLATPATTVPEPSGRGLVGAFSILIFFASRSFRAAIRRTREAFCRLTEYAAEVQTA
jgi:hypothetical protein